MSKNKIFVGGLSYTTTEKGLEEAFAKFGAISEVKVVTDHETQKSKGFGFVTFDTEAAAQNAIADMDGQEIDGRRVGVNIANDKKKEDRGSRPSRPYTNNGGNNRSRGNDRNGYASRW
jgi:RNA recognition motif-containing protein